MLNGTQRAAIRHIIAYESSPSGTRLTHGDWCTQVGVSVRAFERWRLNPEFAAALDAQRSAMDDSSDPYALIARTVALEQLMAMMSKKITVSERRAVIKDVMEYTKHVDTQGDPVDYSDLTDDDLVAAILNRDLSPLGMTEAELKRLAKGEPCSTSPVSSPEEPSSDSEPSSDCSEPDS